MSLHRVCVDTERVLGLRKYIGERSNIAVPVAEMRPDFTFLHDNSKSSSHAPNVCLFLPDDVIGGDDVLIMLTRCDWCCLQLCMKQELLRVDLPRRWVSASCYTPHTYRCIFDSFCLNTFLTLTGEVVVDVVEQEHRMAVCVAPYRFCRLVCVGQRPAKASNEAKTHPAAFWISKPENEMCPHLSLLLLTCFLCF